MAGGGVARYGVYVAAVKKKGAAKEVPQIKKGMQIMRINDTKLHQGIYILLLLSMFLCIHRDRVAGY